MPALDSDELLQYFRFLYRDAIKLQALPEAMQYSELTPEALRPFGLRMARDESEQPVERGSRPERAAKRPRLREAAPAAPAVKKAAPDTSSLTPRQKEIFALVPEGTFSVDVLTGGGIPVSEAVSTLTIFEIYGLIRSVPGGMFEKM